MSPVMCRVDVLIQEFFAASCSYFMGKMSYDALMELKKDILEKIDSEYQRV